MAIPQVKLHPEGPTVSQLIFGTWRLANSNGFEADSSLATPESVLERIEACLELGITTFDLADIYGGRRRWPVIGYAYEELFGKALALNPELRKKMQLITKTGIKIPNEMWSEKVYVNHYDTSYDYVRSQVERSLRLLGTDHLDVVLIHRLDYLLDADETAKVMTDLRNEGKVKYWGVSNHTYTQVELLQSRLDFPLVTNQIEFSPSCLTGMDDGTLDQCQRLRMSPMCWSPLGGGSLFKKDVSNDPKTERLQKALRKVANDFGNDTTLDQAAYSFLLRHPSKPVIVLGTNKIDRLKGAAAIYDKKMNLDRQQFYLIWEASKGHSVP
ncbi:hypothetical protein INT43_008726 [Umbelopsis isabellina]|uniref:NADP-dependent oxidoreductase domain-containing protein n=1 Tax=Mortierella isabellina TaxID=91625 RepID=A0A8H7PX97_MORIS|nr:hypothetical protein INT43_008726 [Umbelopsis isabellina]